jgi:hypothetical protein
MPAPPEVEVNDVAAAPDCDTPLPGVIRPVTISWAEVKESHPDLGTPNDELKDPLEIVNYEVVVEIDETPFRTSIILPPAARSFLVPEEILALSELLSGGEVKFEVLAREVSFNQTAVESCFELL